MELEVTAAQESTSVKKSIILKPTNPGDVKVVLVKQYLSSSDGKEHENEATCNKVDAPSRANKRKSFELAGAEQFNKQCPSGKRKRSVQLAGTSKPTVPLVQDLPKDHNSSLDIDEDVDCIQGTSDNSIQALPSMEHYQSAIEVLPSSTTHVNKSLDLLLQQDDELVNQFQDCILLPNWLDKKNTVSLADSRRVKLDEYKSLFSSCDLDSPQVNNNRKCQSLFETYHLVNKVQKSIVDEM